MREHDTWFKRALNPILRRILRVEITSIICDGRVI
jgi:hypothetical protein